MSDLGQVLKNAREEKSISLEELQVTTKIQKRYLLAIEKGDYGQLPGQFYARAFIKSYAEAVGMDYDHLVEEHTEEMPGANREMPEKLPSRSGRERPRNPGNAKFSTVVPKLLAGVAVIGIIAVVYVVFLHLSEGSKDGLENDRGVSVGLTENSNLNNGNKDEEKNSKGQSTGNQSSEESGSTKEPEQKQQSKQKQKLVKTGTEGNVVHYTLKNADEFKLKLTITDSQCWLAIHQSDAKGKAYESGMFQPGKTISHDLSGDQKVYINIGSTPYVKMSINGKPFVFPNDKFHQKFLITNKGSKES